MPARNTKGKSAVMATLVVAILSSVSPAAGLRLYMVAGTPADDVRIPVFLLSADAIKPKPVVVEAKISDGLTAVLLDYQLGTVVIASPELEPSTFTFINMNAPSKRVVRTLQYSSPDLVPGSIFLMRSPTDGVCIGLAVSKVNVSDASVIFPSDLMVVKRDAESAVARPLSDVQYLRFSGFPGGPIDRPDIAVQLTGDPLAVASVGPARPSTSLPVPPYLKSRSGNYLLISNDDDRAVIESLQERGVLDILDKAKQEWRQVPLPFSGIFRTFGPWVAGLETRREPSLQSNKMIVVDGTEHRVTSPGVEKRKSEKILASADDPDMESESASVEDYFTMNNLHGIIYTGQLFALNLDTGSQIRISTGSGDSEVLLIADNVIYYRVDDALYRADIVGTSLTNKVKLAEGKEIVQAHWAFLN